MSAPSEHKSTKASDTGSQSGFRRTGAAVNVGNAIVTGGKTT